MSLESYECVSLDFICSHLHQIPAPPPTGLIPSESAPAHWAHRGDPLCRGIGLNHGLRDQRDLGSSPDSTAIIYVTVSELLHPSKPQFSDW